MKLSEHVEQIRSLIYKSFGNQFARLGVGSSKLVDLEKIPQELHTKRAKIEVLIDSHIEETGNYFEAREKALDELTFTLFNRLASIKVMEAHQLFPPIVTKEAEHGDRSFGHKMWLEQHPEMRSEELEGFRSYFKHEFNQLGESIPLFNKEYPYALLPYVIELNEIVDAFNAVAKDSQVEDDIWQSDDILGWLYESYNNEKKQNHKDSGDKTEYNKVSIQSQVYTPRWVVEFLVQNSLGKMYLEMYPDSEVKQQFKIANAPTERTREPKPLHELKLIDPASGSGNFLLYAFEFFYVLYLDQIENYGADYDEDDIPQLIIENNLYGVDLDDRAIQLAQLGLWIKAKQRNRSTSSLKFNVVSSDFFLPEYAEVQHIFEGNQKIDSAQRNLIENIWSDLQQAYKFGSLVKIGEKLKHQVEQLYDKQNRGETDLFLSAEITQYEVFEKEFFANLETAVMQFASQQGNSFLTDKTKDAITFLKLITQKYDVATANPPYTASGDFGPDLKKFIDANYKKPYKFHKNLYAVFIKRCFELTNEYGKIGMIHPHTFMFIKDYVDVRKYIIEKATIDLFVDHGLDRANLFDSSVRLDASYYVLSKNNLKIEDKVGTYFFISNTVAERDKKNIFNEILNDLVEGNLNERVINLAQSKLKLIKSWPFIYWISNEFREKFSKVSLEKVAKVTSGIKTGNNNGALRFWWEIDESEIYQSKDDDYKWIQYAKGGPFKRWYGNNWLCIDAINDFAFVKGQNSWSLPPKECSLTEGISYSGSGSKGISFRYIENNILYDMGASGVFPKENIHYALSVLNSKLIYYIVNCLNPTVNKQPNDVKRIPLEAATKGDIEYLVPLAKNCINLRKHIDNFSPIEKEYKNSPLIVFQKSELKRTLVDYLSWENDKYVQIMINEAIINEKIFEVYNLTDSDKAMVLAKEGESIGAFPVSATAKLAYLANEVAEFPLDNIREYIQNLPEQEFEENIREVIENEFPQLYKSNNDLEEFCIRHQVNPINVWYWFKESNVIPKQRMNDLAMEFLADMLREILMEDEDGIIPLVPNAGEKVLLDRIEEKFIEKGFSMAQYSSFESVLGRELNDYINNHFFKAFSDHLNLFMYLPKTPFIWHLTSGPEQGFDCYIIIYKWSRDRLLGIRSVYIEQRERSLENRQSDLRAKSSSSAAEQNELDTIYKQLKEIESFKQKIDELLADGYNPILDDGVGKNIAPLQKKKMIAYDVLNAGQLKKYLNADW